jgi:hypothetical protein
MTWQAMYDNIYDSFIATDASLSSSSGKTVNVRVTDETKGTVIPGGPGQVETIRPTCRVRALDLVSASIDVADLPDGGITLNGQSWIIKATQMRPSPEGELAGEVMLILMSES